MDATRARARLVNAFNQKHWPMVKQRADLLLPGNPNDSQLHFMIGVACLYMQQLERARKSLARACELAPDKADYGAYHALALGKLRRLSEACAEADRVMELHPGNAHANAMLGQVYLQAHVITAAADAFRHAVEREPHGAAYRFQLGYTLAALGDTAGAERELEVCIRIDPRRWSAHLSLSKLKRQHAESHHVARLQTLLRQYRNDTEAQIFLNMALGKELDDLGRYTQAFEHYAHGKRAARSTRPPSEQRDRAMFEALVKAFPDRLPAPDTNATSCTPIFIVGMPRTGTTLLARILSSHRDVYAAGELQNFPSLLQQASGSPVQLLATPDIANRTAHIDWSRLGSDYIASTRPATASYPYFTDDMPLNFLYVGFIARALPHARILCLRRNPLDTCVGNFRQLFSAESGYYDYSLDLIDTGRYYVRFDRLMAHWKTVLPGRILEVSYDTLVQSPEATIRRVLAFCGLAWDNACLHPERNTVPVNTPNAWQVRAPIYSSSIGRWRKYAPQLQSLRELLTASGMKLPD